VYDTQTMQEDKMGEDENQTKKMKIRLRRQKSDYKDKNQTKKTKIRLRRQKSD